MTLLSLPVVKAAVPQPANGKSSPRSIDSVRVLRLSITDRCNFRCVYCMPAEGVPWLAQSQILSFEEICDVVRAATKVDWLFRPHSQTPLGQASCLGSS